jgi:hypothetical protein
LQAFICPKLCSKQPNPLLCSDLNHNAVFLLSPDGVFCHLSIIGILWKVNSKGTISMATGSFMNKDVVAGSKILTISTTKIYMTGIKTNAIANNVQTGTPAIQRQFYRLDTRRFVMMLDREHQIFSIESVLHLRSLKPAFGTN